VSRLVAATAPEKVIVVKASTAPAACRADSMAGIAREMIELPFPVRQWRVEYVRRLAEVIDVRAQSSSR
jgi:recombinational DNA repair ATPase RecF